MKKFLSGITDFLTGLVVPAAIIFQRQLYDGDVPHLLYAIPTILLFFGALYRGRKSVLKTWLTFVLLNFPVLLYSTIDILTSLTPLGSFSVLLMGLLSSVFGLYLAKHWQDIAAQKRRILVFGPIVVVNVVLLFISPLITKSKTLRQYREPAPNFEFVTLAGDTVSSKMLEGKIVVLDFWGTWCVPCIKEFPELEKLYKKYNGHENIAFFAVNSDIGGDTLEKAKSFFEERGYSLPFAYDHNSQATNAFKVNTFPGIVIIDGSGNIRIRHAGYSEREDLVGDLGYYIDLMLGARR